MIIAKYKFDRSLYDLFPEFNSGFSYTYEDEYLDTEDIRFTDANTGENKVFSASNIVTRTIYSDQLPTLIMFGVLYTDTITDREMSLLEIYEVNTSGCIGGGLASKFCTRCINLRSVNGIAIGVNITNLHDIFRDCYNLYTIDVSKWDISNVNNLTGTFYNCQSLTALDVSNFNTSKVISMQATFTSCTSLTSLDVSNFDTSNVNNMRNMFYGCQSLTSLDVSNFDTSKVTTMYCMFYNCQSLTSLDVSNFNTSNVTDMSYMFNNCTSLTSLDVSNFDTGKVTSMAGMFYYCTSLTSLDVSNFDTSKVTDMQYMFYYCKSLTSLDVSNWDTSNVTDMQIMFHTCTSLTSLDLSNFDTSNVSNMYAMFQYCTKLTSIIVSNFDTSKVYNMSYMFSNCNNLKKINLMRWNTDSLENCVGMFESCSSLTAINLSNFNFSKVTNMDRMFCNTPGLVNIFMNNARFDSLVSATDIFNQDNFLTLETVFLAGIDLNSLTKFVNMLPEIDASLGNYKITLSVNTSIKSTDASTLNIKSGWTLRNEGKGIIAYIVRYTGDKTYTPTMTPSNVAGMIARSSYGDGTHLTYFLQNMGETPRITNLSFKNSTEILEVHYVNPECISSKSYANMFEGCVNLNKVIESGIDFTNIINTNSMFKGCTSLQSFDFRAVDTRAITNMASMFEGCTAMISTNLTGMPSSQVTTFNSMYKNCTALRDVKGLGSLDLTNSPDMRYMFYNTGIEDLDMQYFQPGPNTQVDQMVDLCSGLVSMNLSNADYIYDAAMMLSVSSSLQTVYMYNTTARVINSYIGKLPTRTDENPGILYISEDAYDGIDFRLANAYGWVIKTDGDFRRIVEYTCDSDDLILPNFNVGFTDYSIIDKDNGDGTTTRIIKHPDLPTHIDFKDMDSLRSIAYINTEDLKELNELCKNCTQLTEVRCAHWDLKRIESVRSMFEGCTSLIKVDMYMWDTDMLQDMSNLFRGCINLETIGDTSRLNISDVVNTSHMLADCSKLNIEDINEIFRWDISNIMDMTDMFENCTQITDIKLNGWNFNEFASYEGLFNGCNNLCKVQAINSNNDSLFKIAKSLPDRTYAGGGIKGIIEVSEELKHESEYEGNYHEQALLMFNAKNWEVFAAEYLTCEYVFDNTIMDEPLPIMEGVVEYKYIDEVEGNLTTRRLYANPSPTKMSFRYNTCLIKVNYLSAPELTTAEEMFLSCSNLQSVNLNNCDLRYVTSMKNMFMHCNNLVEIDIRDCKTNRLESTYQMFGHCYLLENINLSGMIVDRVSDAYGMFMSCRVLKQINFNGWNPVNLKNVSSMFSGCKTLEELNLTHLKNGDYIDMSYMFSNSTKLERIYMKDMNVANVTDMSYMFNECSSLTFIDCDGWNTISVKTVSGMFTNCSSLESLDIAHFNLKNTEDMSNMFSGCTNLKNIDIKQWDVGKAITLNGLFKNCSSLEKIDITQWNTISVTNMGSMFYGCESLVKVNLSNLKLNNVTNLSGMFIYCNNLEDIVGIDKWNTSKVTTLNNTFSHCNKLKQKVFEKIEKWNIDSLTNMAYTFEKCEGLERIDLSNWNMSGVTTYSSSFYNCINMKYMDMRGWDTSSVRTLFNMYAGCTSLRSLHMGGLNLSNAETFNGLVELCTNLFDLNMSGVNINPTNVGSFKTIFGGPSYTICPNIIDFSNTSASIINLFSTELRVKDGAPGIIIANGVSDVSSINMNNLTNKNWRLISNNLIAYYQCAGSNTDGTSIITMDLAGTEFNYQTIPDINNDKLYVMITSNSKPTTIKFNGSTTLEKVFYLETSGLISCENMFKDCVNLNDIYGETFWDTSNVTNMSNMFEKCSKLTSLDVSNFDTSNVTTMSRMFHTCTSLTSLDVSNFDTSKVTNMTAMFFTCNSLTSLDVSNFDTSNVTDMNSMMACMYSVKSIRLPKMIYNDRKINLNDILSLDHNLEFINIGDIVVYDTNPNLWRVIHQCNNVKHIDLSGLLFKEPITKMCEFADECNSLETLDISNFKINDSIFTSPELTEKAFTGCNKLKHVGMVYCDATTVRVMAQIMYNCGMRDVNIYVSKLHNIALPDTFKMVRQQISVSSVYLPTDVVIRNDGNSDKLYYDYNLNRICVLKNVNGNTERRIGLNFEQGDIDAFNPKVYVKADDANLSLEGKAEVKVSVPFIEFYKDDVNISYMTYNYTPEGTFNYRSGFKIERGDYVEALLDLRNCTTSGEVLTIGELVDYTNNSNIQRCTLSFDISTKNISININGTISSKTVKVSSRLLVRLDKTGLYINDKKVSDLTGDATFNTFMESLNNLRYIEVGNNNQPNGALYTWIRVIRNLRDGDLAYNYHYETIEALDNGTGILLDSDNIDVGHNIEIIEVSPGIDGNENTLGEYQSNGLYKISISSTSASAAIEE